ncbi:hypothetical protein EJB05_19647 [Eragrostis curvula]|uniref:Uncharacterized protein n=1 Tax=Eragrostis curvula TaxID=38414 RepID=A0A5J9UXY9_9POAL|nr:hypothetical protein EJB05_19647 [Eragrostis curvula]
MEKGSRGLSCRAAICGIVALLSVAAFSCTLAAEFHKVKEKDMKVDGSLCSLPKSAAFELGVAAIAFLLVAQLVGTTAAVTAAGVVKPKKSSPTRRRVAFVALLVLSWASFAVAVILLATAASMNHGQRYGRGWMDGDCYVAKNGVFGVAAALVVVTAIITLGLTFATEPPSSSSAAAGMAPAPAPRAAASAASTTTHFDAEQPGGRSKQ